MSLFPLLKAQQGMNLTLKDIEDEEDIYNRIEINQLKKTRAKKKKKKKSSYGDDESKDWSGTTSLNEKVSIIENNLKPANKLSFLTPDSEYQINVRDGERSVACNWILHKFDIQSLSSYFPQSATLYDMHMFRLFVYSVLYNQENFFDHKLKSVYFKVFNDMLRSKAKNKQLRQRFTVTSSASEVNAAESSDFTKRRKIEKIQIPPIILRRLNIQEPSTA